MTFPSPGRFMWGLFFFTVQQPYSVSGCLIVEVSRSRTDASLSVGLLRRRDRRVAEAKHNIHRDRHICAWWDSNPQSQ